MAPIAISPELYPVQQVSLEQKPTVYLLDSFHPAAVARAQELFNVILPGTPEHQHWRDAEYLLVRSSRLTAADISSCSSLVAIGKQGVGIDKIDVAACSARGIKIFNTPGVNARAVAELVLTLTTALAREVRSISLRMADGQIVPKEACSGQLLHNSTVGILGMGNIGRTVASIFRGAFESKIIAYDPYMNNDAWQDIPHKRVKKIEDLLHRSDIVTIHIPLTTETRNLISYQEMQKMKRNAILINTARGGIVNESDLCRALDDGLIWGAGLDCHEQEPPTMERYEMLWRHPNVISMPHIGAATAKTQMDTAIAAVEKLHDYVKLVAPRNSRQSVIEL